MSYGFVVFLFLLFFLGWVSRSECGGLVVVCGGGFFGLYGLFWWLWVDFDWGVVVDIGGLGGFNCGSGFGFFGFIWRWVWMLLCGFLHLGLF